MIGTYADTYKAGMGVISQNAYGEGTAYYIGTGISGEVMRKLLSSICLEAGIEKIPFEIPEKVEVVKRRWNGRNCYFIMNFTQKTVEFSVNGSYKDAVTEQKIEGNLTMDAQGFALLLED